MERSFMKESPMPSKPIVLIPACARMNGPYAEYATKRPYVEAVRLAGCQPLLVPGNNETEIEALLDLADGVLLSGAEANVHPSHFGEEVRNPALPLDTDRDAWTLPLIREAVRREIPLMGICRGLQEINVALGGSLHQAVHELPGMADHRPDEESAPDERYGAAHEIELQPGGILEQLLGEPKVVVNSVHGQGVHRLAAGLKQEATARDGLLEAFSSEKSAGFLLGTQWHPEWNAAGNPVSAKIFHAFGDACRAYRTRKLGRHDD